METGLKTYLGSFTVRVFPEPAAELEAPRIDEGRDKGPQAEPVKAFFRGADKLYLPPKSVAAIISALNKPGLTILNIKGEPIRLENTIQVNVWKIINMPPFGKSAENILRFYPEPDKEISLIIHISELEQDAIRAELSKYISTGLEIPITA